MHLSPKAETCAKKKKKEQNENASSSKSKRSLSVCLRIVYLAEIEIFLLKVL